MVQTRSTTIPLLHCPRNLLRRNRRIHHLRPDSLLFTSSQVSSLPFNKGLICSLPSFYKELKKYHLAHHYKNFELGYGVTSKFWDTIFGTLTSREAKEANDRDGVGLGAENQECGIGCGGGVHWMELFRQKGKLV
jgi:hypothetical protein